MPLQQGHRRIEHDGGIDLALLHRRNRGGAEADADHGDRVRIDAVLAQHVLEEEIGRGAGRADADFLVGEILDRIDFRSVLGRDHQRKARVAVIDHEGLQVLALGGEIDAVVEIARHHVGAAANDGLERFRAALEVDDVDVDARLFEFAELLGEHRRQIAQAAAATDRERDLRLREREAARQHKRGEHRDKPPENCGHDFLPCFARPFSRPFGRDDKPAW